MKLDSIPLIPCHRGNYGADRDASAIKYLVYHYTGNDGDTARANATYYATATVKASAHYFVDDTEIIRSVPDVYTAWAVGGSKWSDCAQTGGGQLHGIVTNANSINIEMCDTLKDGKLMASEATLKNAVELGKALMERYGIPIGRVVRHFDVTGKHCPAYFMDNAAWESFKGKIAKVEESEDFSMHRYNDMDQIYSEAPWAAPIITKLIKSGAIRGGGVKDRQGLPADMRLSEDMLRVLVIIDRAKML